MHLKVGGPPLSKNKGGGWASVRENEGGRTCGKQKRHIRKSDRPATLLYQSEMTKSASKLQDILGVAIAKKSRTKRNTRDNVRYQFADYEALVRGRSEETIKIKTTKVTPAS